MRPGSSTGREVSFLDMHEKDNLYFKQITEESLLTQRIRSDVLLLIHHFFSSQGFILVDPPVLHEYIPKKRNEIYLPFHREKYSLNSSNALYMGAYAALFERVYAISPTFRDEQNSVNHLVEFRMLEVEALGLTFAELPALIDRFIVFLLKELAASKNVQKNGALASRIDMLLESFHPQIERYDDFILKIRQRGGPELGAGTDVSDVDYDVSKFLRDPVFITDYPRHLASWTAKPKSGNKAIALNLLLPGSYGELCEGCERTNDVELLRYKMHCARISCLQWYLDAIGRISAPRCGFGIGVDRLIRWISGLPCVQDSLLFPRTNRNKES